MIAGGYSESNISGEKTQNSRAFNDYWVVELDRLGNIQGRKTIRGNSVAIWFRHLKTGWMVHHHPPLKNIPFVLALPLPQSFKT